MCGGEGGRSCQEGWEGSRKEEHHPPTPESWKDLAAQEEAFFPAAAAAEGVSARGRGGRTDCPVLSPEKVGERREIPLKRHKRERRKVERREQDIFVTLKSGENEEVEKVPFSSPFLGVGAVARSRAPPPPP